MPPIENPVLSKPVAKEMEPTIASPPKTRSAGKKRFTVKDQIEQLTKELAEEKAAKASAEAELKLKTEECSALKTSTNGIVTAAVQLQPLLQSGYIMPETLQQFNYFVYWAQMKVIEDQQRTHAMAKEKETLLKQAAEQQAQREYAEEEARKQRELREVAAAKAKQAAEARKAQKDAELLRKAKAEADAKNRADAEKAVEKLRQQAAAAAAAEKEEVVAENPADGDSYDPHAPPTVFGGWGSNSNGNVNASPNAFSIADFENKMVQQQQKLKKPLGEQQKQQQEPAVAEKVVVTKPKPTSWAGLVAHNIDNDAEVSQNVPPTTANNPNILAAPATTNKPVAKTVNNKNIKSNSNNKFNKNTRNNSTNNNRNNTNTNNKFNKNNRFNSKNNANNRFNKNTSTNTNTNTQSPAATQYMKDIEMARQLQANIDSYDGTRTVENEWSTQSKKGSAKAGHVGNARQIAV